MKDPTKMTRKEFEQVPVRKWDEETKDVTAIVVLPTAKKHDSGYRLMDFVLVSYGKCIYRTGAGSDVLWMQFASRGSISVDCLPKSGLLQVFFDEPITVGRTLSSLSVYLK